MVHISQGDDHLYREARNVAVLVAFGEGTAKSAYIDDGYETHEKFVSALLSHIAYLERIGDPNRLVTHDVKKFVKLCGRNSAKPFKETEEKTMEKQNERENPEVMGLDFEEAYKIGKLTQFTIPINPDGHIIGDREEYIRGLIDHIDSLRTWDISPEIRDWQAKARAAIKQ